MEEFFLASELTLEILLVLGVSFVGASVHEYVFRSEGDRVILKNPNVWISTIVSSIICYTVDPWIATLNPRLMLLPPLLLGMAGMDLVRRLSTVEGSSSIIEYILGFFGITNKKTEGTYGIPTKEKEEENTPSLSIQTQEAQSQISTHPDPVLSTSNFEQLMTLDQMVHAILDSICNLSVDYYIHHDKGNFLHGYYIIKINIEIMHNHMKSHQFIPISTALKLSEVLKKELELETIYRGIISQNEPNSHNPTSN